MTLTCNPTRQVGESYVGVRGNLLNWFAAICKSVELGVPLEDISKIAQRVTNTSLQEERGVCSDIKCEGIGKFGDRRIKQFQQQLLLATSA